jgi:hypothetical protein
MKQLLTPLWHTFAVLILSSHLSHAQSASDLAGKLAAAVEDGNSLTKLRLTIKPNSGGKKTSLNMQIKARRNKGKIDVLYQVLFPKDRKGQSILLSKEGSNSTQGYSFTPPEKTARRVNKAKLTESILGSDLTYQDIIENFFRWKNQAITGQEAVGRVNCIVLESKPGSSDATPYRLVKSWIDPKKLVALRVIKYDKAGKPAQQIDTTQIARDDKGRSVPAGLTIRRTGSGTKTTIDGSSIRHDVKYTDEDFTTRKMASFKVAR